MKARNTITHLLLLGALAAYAPSCGPSARRTLSDAALPAREATFTGKSLTVWLDDHTRTRREADAVFDAWLDSRGMRRGVTGRRLMSVNPSEDGCRLTYDFRTVDGTEQRVVLLVPDYRQAYRKKGNRTKTAYINGRMVKYQEKAK